MANSLKLTSPGATRALLAQFGIRARKKYGQNFLTDANIVRGIVEAAGIGEEDCVLEIGPGIGTMTQELSEAAGRVICVEIDENLRPVLAQTLEDCTNVTILWQDILKTDLRALSETWNEGRPLKVVANLPYYVTTPILLHLLEEKGCFSSITVMVQKEVADRICAGPGSREYGALSLAVQYYTSPEIVLKVPPSCFLPRPAVESAVLFLQAYEEPPVDAEEGFLFAPETAVWHLSGEREITVDGMESGYATVVYYARPVRRTELAAVIALPDEFTELAASRLKGEAYRAANEDVLATKWLGDYNQKLDAFSLWCDRRRPGGGAV